MIKKFLYNISLKKYIDECVEYYDKKATEKEKRDIWLLYFFISIYSFIITMVLMRIVL